LERQASWSNQTRNYFLTVLNQFVDYVKANALIPNPAVNPKEFYDYSLCIQELERVRRISRYSVKREVERRSLSLDELARLLDASEGDYPAFFFIWCYAYFGLRRSELLKITVKDIDFGQNKLKISASMTKGAPRYFYFNDETRRILEGALDYYGVTKGRIFPVSPAAPNMLLKPYQKHVEPELTTHTFRHTFGTWMRQALRDDGLLKFLMGHKGHEDISDYYTTVFEDQVKRAMLERHYFNMLK